MTDLLRRLLSEPLWAPEAEAGAEDGAGEGDAAAASAGAEGDAVGKADGGKAAEGDGKVNGKTIANGGSQEGAGEGQQQERPYWPEDWQERIAKHFGAGNDKATKDELKQIKRYADPVMLWGKARELERMLSTGNRINLPGKDAKPEEIAAFNKALGVPEKVEDYFTDLKLDNGAIIGELDKPVVDEFASAVHKAGATPAVMQAALNWYFASQEKQAADLDDADENFRVESNRALKEEFGNAFQRYTNSISTLFNSAPGGTDASNEGSLFSRLMAGRTADGKIIGNDPDMVRWLVGLAREVSPEATVTGSGDQSGMSVEAELDKIRTVMRTDRRKYEGDKQMQKRYMELLDAHTKIQARKSA